MYHLVFISQASVVSRSSTLRTHKFHYGNLVFILFLWRNISFLEGKSFQDTFTVSASPLWRYLDRSRRELCCTQPSKTQHLAVWPQRTDLTVYKTTNLSPPISLGGVFGTRSNTREGFSGKEVCTLDSSISQAKDGVFQTARGLWVE